MLVYWTMFAVPALSTLFLGTRRTIEHDRPSMGLMLILLLFTLLVGLRFQVGTDWYNYKNTIDNLYYQSFGTALTYKDPSFGVLVWLANRAGSGLYITNVFCAGVMMYGIQRFSRAQPDPWMAVTASVPYLVIVVGMGYTRQAAAIGFVLLAILAFERRQLYRFMILLVVAATFHGSSLCLLPLAGIAVARKDKALLIPMALVAAVLFAFLLSRRVENLYALYVTREQSFDSSGALVRLVMNAVPAGLFLYYRRAFKLDEMSDLLWTLFSFVGLGLLVVFFVFPSSTAIDRLGLYFIPIQLFVFGNLPGVMGVTRQGIRAVSFGIILYYGATLFVWLEFASNAHAWFPYQFAPLAA